MTPYWTSRDGRHALYLGDCLDVLPGLAPGSVGAVVTDPPYSSGGMYRSDRMKDTRTKYQLSSVVDEKPLFSGDNRDQRSWCLWCCLWMGLLRRTCRSGAVLATFTDWRQLPTATDAIQAAGWLWLGIASWDKVDSRPMPNRFRQQTEFLVWGSNGPRPCVTSPGTSYHAGAWSVRPPKSDREHSTQKPVKLLEMIVAIADDDDLVLDPFAGSGTTGVACIRTGRRFIGVELEPRYADIAVRRMERELERRPLPGMEPEADPCDVQPELFAES